MDPELSFEEIDVVYNNQKFKTYVYKHPNLIEGSAVFIIRINPLIKKYTEAEFIQETSIHTSENHDYGSEQNIDNCSGELYSILKALTTAIRRHFHSY